MRKLDSRQFSQEAYCAIISFKNGDNNAYLDVEKTELRSMQLREQYHKKATSLIQGISTYVATWGLHHLSGDAAKFLRGTAEDTTYKGIVYREFLYRLRDLSQQNFDPRDAGTLMRMPLVQYTALNHLAMQLAKEWSFWAASVLGEAEKL